MATIKFGGSVARTVTQVGGYGQKAGLLAPHMVKATITMAAVDTTKILRVVPPYACDTWEVFVILEANDPQIQIYGLDDDYSGTGTPDADDKHELTELSGISDYDQGFVASMLPVHFIVDRAWKGLQFDVTDESNASVWGAVHIKVKAYRSGQCTFEGTYSTGSVETV